MERNEFSTLDIIRALNIKRERLREWMNLGFIEPTEPSRKQGSKAIFTRQDVYCVALFEDLIESGYSRAVAALWVSMFQRECAKDHRPVYYIVTEHELHRRTEKGTQLQPGEPFDGLRYRTSSTHFKKIKKPRLISIEKPDKIALMSLLGKATWEHLHIINFKAIRERVDEELKNLS